MLSSKKGNYFIHTPPPTVGLSPIVNKRSVIPCQMRNTSASTRVRSGFTLIELLVVVLIIGILTAIAVPQYQKIVEKARMTEAISIIRTIANASQVFYMTRGRYADQDELELLDIDIPGELMTSGNFIGRKKTAYFFYSPRGGGTGNSNLAVAQRIPYAQRYYIYINRDDPGRIHCHFYQDSPGLKAVQRKLCQELDASGTL